MTLPVVQLPNSPADHWLWRCPDCGAQGYGQGRHRTLRNLAAHWRRCKPVAS